MSEYTFTRPFAVHHAVDATYTRPPSFRPQPRDHLSKWFGHEMKPRDAYGPQEHSRSKPMPPITRVSANPPKVTGAGLSEINSGLEWAGSLYKPSKGETLRANRKKGYFNNPDKEVPRLPPRGEPPIRNNKKVHSLGLTDADMPPRAPFNSQSEVLANCLRASDHGSKRFFIKTNDDVWTPADAPVKEDLKHAKLFQKEAMDYIQIAAKQRESDKLKRAEERRKDKRAVEVFDPWSHPQKGNPNHAKVSLEAAQAQFDKKVAKSTWVGEQLGKFGSGAPSLDAATGKLKTGMSYDAETHLRNAYKTTQNSGDAVMTYSRKDHFSENAAFGRAVKAQAEEQKRLRRSQRENSMMAKMTEKGFAASLGKYAGSGAANRTSSGKVNTRVQGGLGTDAGTSKKEPRLGQFHQQQISESEMRRKMDKNPQRYEKFEKFDPFEKQEVVRDEGGYIKGGKQLTKKGVGLVAPDVVVPGATLANVMGTPGGGAQNVPGGTAKLFAAMDHEEYDVETKAQAAGKSQWNKAGGGGPIRLPDGSINTKTLGRSEMDKSGVTDMKNDPDYHARIAQIRAQQEVYLKLKKEERKAFRAADKALEKKKAGETFMTSDSNPHHTGKAVPDRFIKPKKDLYGRVKPAPDTSHARAYEAQIREKETNKKEALKRSQSADRKHLAVVSEWQGKGVGHPWKGADGHVTGVFKKDLSIHPEIDASDIASYSPQVAARKAKYHAELTKTKERKAKAKRENKIRRAADEAEHNRNEMKHFNRPGAGAPRRTASGRALTRPGNSGDMEYKMLAVPMSNLS